MFTEPIAPHTGWIEVICGSMFSGKTEELIRRLRRALIAKQRVEIFKPAIDTRYSEQNIVSHNATEIRSTPLQSCQELMLLGQGINVIGIDEAQFFDESLIEVVQFLANQGTRIIIAGLDQDFRGKPFGIMPSLLAIAEYVTKVHAICAVCGSVANYSYRFEHIQSKKTVLLGEKESYEPRCRSCFVKGMQENTP